MKYKILVIENEVGKSRELEKLLEEDYEIIDTSTYEQGMEILEKHFLSIAAVLVSLDEEKGFQFLKGILQNATLQQIPIAGFSHSHNIEDEERAYELGISEYIRVDFNAKITLYKIKKYDSSLSKCSCTQDDGI